MSKKLQGSWTALITPFNKGRIDWESLKNLVEWHIESKTDGLVLCGTTAETPTLSEEEQSAVIRKCAAWGKGRIGLMAGCGNNSTEKTIKAAKALDDLGLDAFLIVTPYYNRPQQRGLVEHFTAVSAKVKTPVVIYNVPSRTGVNMEPATVLETLKKAKNIAGIKEASGQLDQVSVLCRQAPEDFAVLSGDDSLTLPMMSVGAKGVISVASNAAPRETGRMVREALAGNFEEAKKLHLKLMPLFKGLFMETNPVPVKAALAAMKRIKSAEVRLPLAGLSQESLPKLKKALTDSGIKF